MIVKMKRLTLLCLTADRDAALEALRALGVVHVTDRRPPAGEELDALRARLADAERALDALPEPKDGAAPEPEPAADADEVVAEVLALLDRRAGARRPRGRRCAASWPATTASGSSTSTAVRELERAGVATAARRGAAGGATSRRRTAPCSPSSAATATASYFSLVGPRRLAGRPAGPRRPTTTSSPGRSVRSRRSAKSSTALGRRPQATADARLAALAAGRDGVAELAAQTADAELRSRRCAPAWTRPRRSPCSPATCRSAEQRRAADGCRRARLGHRPRRPGARRRRAHAAAAVALGEAGPHGVRLPEHLPGLLGVRRRLGLPSVLQPLLRDDRRRRRLRASCCSSLTVVLQRRLKKVPAHVFHMMYIVGLRHARLGSASRAATSASRRCPASSRRSRWPGSQDRDNLIDLCFLIGAVHLSFAHVWNAVSLVQARDVDQGARPGRLADRRLVDVLPRPPDRPRADDARLPPLRAGRRASCWSPCS